MNSNVKQKLTFREVLKTFSTIISWTIFVLLMICAIFLIYYFIATRIYMAKGSKYEPKFSLYTIISPSMVPNINVYDVIIDSRVDSPSEIEIGDVITFYSDAPEVNGGTVTHRVISIIKDKSGKYSYQTKGDNNIIEDSSTVPFEKIVGKVVLKIPQLGRVQFFLASNMGWLFLILIPALYIIFKDIFKLFKIKAITNKTGIKIKNPFLAKLKFIMTKPLLPFKKKKLLTYTPPKLDLKDEVFKENYYEDIDEIEISDLPKLK